MSIAKAGRSSLLTASFDLECIPPLDRPTHSCLTKSMLAKVANAPQRRVTIMGDAAHPMCPFRAQGANQALSDAVLFAEVLAESIRKHGPQKGLDEAPPVFEKKMLSRAARM
eukprot:6439534-Amphidinium_carterae.1